MRASSHAVSTSSLDENFSVMCVPFAMFLIFICTKPRLLPGVRCVVSMTCHRPPLCMMKLPLRMLVASMVRSFRNWGRDPQGVYPATGCLHQRTGAGRQSPPGPGMQAGDRTLEASVSGRHAAIARDRAAEVVQREGVQPGSLLPPVHEDRLVPCTDTRAPSIHRLERIGLVDHVHTELSGVGFEGQEVALDCRCRGSRPQRAVEEEQAARSSAWTGPVSCRMTLRVAQIHDRRSNPMARSG